jgi:hypothetical protein
MAVWNDRNCASSAVWIWSLCCLSNSRSVRAVPKVSTNTYGPARPWVESDKQDCHRAASESYAANAAGASEGGPKAEMTPCEHGFGSSNRRDSPWCGGCGGHKPGSWACLLCNRVNPSCDIQSRSRFQGYEGTRVGGRPVGTRPGSADAQRGLRILELRRQEKAQLEKAQLLKERCQAGPAAAPPAPSSWKRRERWKGQRKGVRSRRALLWERRGRRIFSSWPRTRCAMHRQLTGRAGRTQRGARRLGFYLTQA